MKIKIFNTISNKPQDSESIIQKWLDSFEQRGKVIDIKYVCHEFVDNEHIVQTLFIYEEHDLPKNQVLPKELLRNT